MLIPLQKSPQGNSLIPDSLHLCQRLGPVSPVFVLLAAVLKQSAALSVGLVITSWALRIAWCL